MIEGFKFVAVQEITVHAARRNKGSNMITFNVDVDGAPFGQIWTFKAKGETHGFHAKTLADAYANFTTFEAAVDFIRNEA